MDLLQEMKRAVMSWLCLAVTMEKIPTVNSRPSEASGVPSSSWRARQDGGTGKFKGADQLEYDRMTIFRERLWGESQWQSSNWSLLFLTYWVWLSYFDFLFTGLLKDSDICFRQDNTVCILFSITNSFSHFLHFFFRD